MTCPLNYQQILGALARGEFRAMDDSDYDGFAGVEYDGYMWEPEGVEAIVVLDHGPGGYLFNVVSCNPDADGTWVFEMSADRPEPEAL